MKYVWYFLLSLMSAGCAFAQTGSYVGSVVFPADASLAEKVRLAAHVVPSERQIAWQQMETTCFICFGINTFTDREWGTGKEDLSLFNPSQLDARQWVRTAKEAGMKLVLLTCKHHDGFCLWPSKYTDFSVASTPWKNGKGDVVREVADACRAEGLKFGVYLSPWDMNHPDYGTEKYNDYFVNQLTELLTEYGTIHEVWFDGACGEGPNGRKQEYDFQRYYSTVRALQPQAVIAVMGPDVRWVGTESGYGRDTEWSVIPASDNMLASIAASSQQEAGNGTYIPEGSRMKKDLGSRLMLEKAGGAVWYPSEVDVSIRPGWYYHAAQDSLVKSPQKLIDIYYSSVGKNSLLLLNLPPDKRGLIHENDRQSLMAMKRILDETFSDNLLEKAVSPEDRLEALTDKRLDTGWRGLEESLQIRFQTPVTFDRILLQENIREGQRIEEFCIEYKENDAWHVLATGTTVGYKRLLRTDKVTCRDLKISVRKCRDVPMLSELGLFLASPEEVVP